MTAPEVRSEQIRPLRADARRNRATILHAAQEQITANGPDVGMDQIAAAAGVAVGTVYRHFPTKTDLVAAVISAHVAQVADHADLAVGRLNGGSPAFEELAGLLREIVQAAATNHAVKAAAGALNADVDDSADVRRAGAAVQTLIDAARADRAVRDDLSISDFYLLVGNIPTDRPPVALQRWVDLTLFGLTGPRSY